MDDTDPRHARFAAVVLPHLDPLLAFARRRTAAEADAEDAVQDACVRAWRALDELWGDAHALSWLYQILRHVLGGASERHARRDALAPTVPLDDIGGERFASDIPSALDSLIAAAATEEAERALDLVPEHYATAVALRDLDGLSCRDVAAALGVPAGTALSRIHRGRQLLARAIATTRAAEAARATARRDAPVTPEASGTRRSRHDQAAPRQDAPRQDARR